MKLRKGAALPGAIMLCFMLLIISYAVGASILQMVANNKLEAFKTEQKEVFASSYKQFLASFNTENITDTKYQWESELTENYAGLAAYSKNSDDLYFYAIYDITNEKTIAYQTSNFYKVDGKLGGILSISRS